jgi:hypothetical protein
MRSPERRPDLFPAPAEGVDRALGLPEPDQEQPYAGPALVQPVIVLANSFKPASYIDAVHAITLASVLVYAQELVTLEEYEVDPAWAPWLAGGGKRAILRANNKDFDRLRQQYAAADMDHTFIDVGRARAMALHPMEGRLPKELRRLTECRAVFPDRNSGDPVTARPSGSPIVVVDSSLGLLAADAASHAADSMLAWFTSLAPEVRSSWYDPGCKFSVIALPVEHFSRLALYSSHEGSISRTENGRAASFLLPPRHITIKDRH